MQPLIAMFVLLGTLLLFLSGMVAIVLTARFYRHYVSETAAGVALLLLLIWVVGGWRLPLTLTVSHWPAAAQLATWTWHVDDIAWRLSLYLLLLMAAVLIVNIARSRWPEEQGGGGAEEQGPHRGAGLHLIMLLALTLAGLIALWADSLAGLLTNWTLLAFVWSLPLLGVTYQGWARPSIDAAENGTRREGEMHQQARQLAVRLGASLASLFCIWLAAVTLQVPLAEASLDMSGWPTRATAWILLAAVLKMGVFPLHIWRPFTWRFPPPLAALMHAVPALAGLSLLGRLVLTSNVTWHYNLLLTAFGLLGFLAGVSMAWAHLNERSRLPPALALAQVSLVLLAGVWAGVEAVVAEASVLVLAVGALFLTPRLKAFQSQPWLASGSLVAVAALAGLPLTAGFAGRAALYNAWLENGRFILVLVAAIIHVPLIAAALLHVWQMNYEGRITNYEMPGAIATLAWLVRITNYEGRRTKSEIPGGPTRLAWRPIIYAFGLLLPALALISIGLRPANVKIITWLALLLPVIGGIVLSRHHQVARETRRTLRQVIPLNVPLPRIYQGLGATVTAAGSALREAANILEGEGGMLWLLLLLAIVWLSRGA